MTLQKPWREGAPLPGVPPRTCQCLTWPALALVLLAACARSAPAPAPVFFPPPPDTARIQFLARFSGAADFDGNRRSFVDRVTGANRTRPEIQKPYGIGVGPGVVYVCDTRLPGVAVIDLESRTFRQVQPSGRGQLSNPVACAVDADGGRLLVADPARGEVVVFDTAWSVLATFGLAEGLEPVDVVVDGDRIWVADLAEGRVVGYDGATYARLLEFPSVEPPDSASLRQPVSLAVFDGEVFVSDGLQFTVKVYGRDGRYLRSIGRLGRGPGQFARQKGIAVDRNGYLYAVDAAFQNVQIFDRSGRVLTFFGGPYRGPGYLYMPARVVVDDTNLEYFRDRVDPDFELEHLVFVTNQFGPDKVTVYGFVTPREVARVTP